MNEKRVELLERTLAIVAQAAWPEDWETVVKVAAAQAESEINYTENPKVKIETTISLQFGESPKEVIEVKK